ncbi:glucans biosynthesis glucosyltransferase MdoH [Rhizobium sp. CRIBSB]|nr:glucans biosynthesis glucosyltransferase MdoH [Rhizobium sp. CRIBSB]
MHGSSRLAIDIDDKTDAAGRWAWLPAESVLEMPRQDVSEPSPAIDAVLETSPADVNRRRLILTLGTVALAALSAIAPAILYAREGWDGLEVTAFVLFMILITAIGCWFISACAGLVVLLRGRADADLAMSDIPAPPTTRTALLMPLYNEDARAAFARLGQIDESLAALGVSDAFDFFVLSDSTRDEAAMAELSTALTFRPKAHSQVYYRRRMENVERKAGNIADWTRRFGGDYEFMVVLDADSVMAGETLVRMVDAMERNPGVGLLQTTPTIINASTLFARISQFSVRLYGRVAAAGLSWWAGSEASYWGHNAILRTRAFAECAGLPILEGRKPFGGHVLSHDVVEAALMRRAGWAVHVTAALDGSCEETPPTVTDFIRRDHRWCQGNLQHLGMLRARGLSPMSRLQLAMGCMAYLSSPLWFASLAVGLLIQMQYPIDWTSFWYFLNPQFTPFMLASFLAGVLLIGPKIMGGLLVLSRPEERRSFGGGRTLIKGMAMEILLSALMAPILMVANTRAVVKILSGHDAGWHAQQRDTDGLSWGDAFRAMRWQMITGVVFAAGLVVRPDLATWFAPVVLPLLFAVPLCVVTSRRRIGDAAARAGFMVIPEEDGLPRARAIPRAAEIEPAAA